MKQEGPRIVSKSLRDRCVEDYLAKIDTPKATAGNLLVEHTDSSSALAQARRLLSESKCQASRWREAIKVLRAVRATEQRRKRAEVTA